MARAAYVRSSFLGGEWSKLAQGRVTDPAYLTALNVCLNAIPIEAGAWQRRGGTQHCNTTRDGRAAKLIGFDVKQPFPYQMLLSESIIRYLSEASIVTTNDDQTITALSTANPAVVTTAAAHGWISGNHVRISSNVLKLNRRDLYILVLSANTFSLLDPGTGASIDGSTLDTFTSGTVSRIAETATPYTGDLWRTVRSIQAETTAVLVNGKTAPYVLTVTQEPSAAAFAEFDLAAGVFLDGPYLDAIPGSWATAGALSGVVAVTLSFQTYDPTRAYIVGEYVTYSGQGYRSLQSNNQNKQPDAWPAYWIPVNAGDPFNDGAGFTAGDIGRLIRLFSEPAPWASGTSYTIGQIVTYEAAGEATGYYEATGSISGGDANSPGRSTTWAVRTGASVARWTWGRILSISTAGVTAPDVIVGNFANNAPAFDGNASKSFASSSNTTQATATRQSWHGFPWPLNSEVQYNGRLYRLDVLFTAGFAIDFSIPPSGYPFWTDIGAAANISIDNYVGGHMAAPTQISQVVITPPSDTGFSNTPQNAVGLNLRAKATAPSGPSDGTLLGSAGTIANTTSPISIVSGDQTTAWNYVWVEITSSYNQPLPDDGTHFFTAKLGIAQVQFRSPNIANGSAINVQIVGDPLLYANACRKWRLGLFGGSNGYPSNGTYDDNRIWLSGVVGNRVDSSKSGAFRNGTLVLDMAPTAPDGTVTDAHAISATFTAPDVNAIFWMEPDQQGILCGTQAGEWLLGPAAPGAISPLNIKAARVTKIGCANILPRRTDHTLVFAQRYLQKIQEYFADVYSGKFSSPHLTKNSKHMTASGLSELAYQQELASIVWARLANGTLMGITYQRDSLTTARGPDIAGAHRHILGSGRLVRSISVGASANGNLDSLYMVTEDPGGGNFHVEVMRPLLSEGFSFSDCWFLDNALVPTNITIDATATVAAPYGGVWLYGLMPHVGKTVAAYVCGLDAGSRGLVKTSGTNQPTVTDFVVEANGSLFIPFGDGVNQGCGDGLLTQALVARYVGASSLPMVVGFPFVSDGQIVRPVLPQESGARLGPGLGNEMRDHKVAALLYGCVPGTISFGIDFDHLMPAKMTDADRITEIAKNVLFSGIVKDPIDTDTDMDQMICWRVSRPHPAAVLAIAGKLQSEDE